LLPLIQISPAPAIQVDALSTDTVVTTVSSTVVVTSAPSKESTITQNEAFTAIYCIGVASMLVTFILKLYSALKLIIKGTRMKYKGYTLVLTPDAQVPFSFFRYLFVNNTTNMDEAILRHEIVHIRQKHSLDIILTELLKAFCWFNPTVYFLQNSLKALHEFEADRSAALDQRDNYVDLLIGQACINSGISIANHFSDNQLLKTRIMKLYQKRSGKLARLNYLISLPLCAVLMYCSSSVFAKHNAVFKIDLYANSKAIAAVRPSSPAGILMVSYNGSAVLTNALKVIGRSGNSTVFTAKNVRSTDINSLSSAYRIKVKVLQNASVTVIDGGVQNQIMPTPLLTISPNIKQGSIAFPKPKVSTSSKLKPLTKTTATTKSSSKDPFQMNLNKYLIINLVKPTPVKQEGC
jgi:hypothetical protein